MTVVASGQIRVIGDIAAEFGGSGQISVLSYYGAGGVPASGELQISDFYGTSDTATVIFNADSISVERVTSQGTGATARLNLSEAGRITIAIGTGTNRQWVATGDLDTLAASAYEYRFSATYGGSTPLGYTTAWTIVPASQNFSLTKTGQAAGSKYFNGTLEIRAAGDDGNSDSITVNMNAIVT